MLFQPEFIINVDGASRGNPGEASYGFVIVRRDGELVHEESKYIGQTTNNVAEYTALVKALEFAATKKIASVEIRSDSQLLVRQILGQYKVKSENIEGLYRRCCDLLRKFESFEINHVPREQNKHADRLANQALDRRKAEIDDIRS